VLVLAIASATAFAQDEQLQAELSQAKTALASATAASAQCEDLNGKLAKSVDALKAQLDASNKATANVKAQLDAAITANAKLQSDLLAAQSATASPSMVQCTFMSFEMSFTAFQHGIASLHALVDRATGVSLLQAAKHGFANFRKHLEDASTVARMWIDEQLKPVKATPQWVQASEAMNTGCGAMAGLHKHTVKLLTTAITMLEPGLGQFITPSAEAGAYVLWALLGFALLNALAMACCCCCDSSASKKEGARKHKKGKGSH
jgi:hypothetical protein